jgi:hypothetical protein
MYKNKHKGVHMLKTLTAKLVDLLRYPSTYQGLAALLGVFGVALSPEHAQEIGLAVATIIGTILTLFSDSDVQPK